MTPTPPPPALTRSQKEEAIRSACVDCQRKRTGLCNKHYKRWRRHGDASVCKMGGSQHSQYRHGMFGTRGHRIWCLMKRRCLNPNDESYPRYGGAGITVCPEWMTFEGFWKDMGPTYFDEAHIDRINNDLGYSRENCRWVTFKESQRNKRSVRTYWYRGARRTIPEIAALRGMKEDTLYARLVKYKWPLERAVSLPAHYGNRYAS